MSDVKYLTFKKVKKQGLISANCSTVDSIGNRYQTGHKRSNTGFKFRITQ